MDNTCNRFCGEYECNEKQNENPMLCKRVTDKLHKEKPSDEFTWWAAQTSFTQMVKDNNEKK
jgi:hypothetical protein